MSDLEARIAARRAALTEKGPTLEAAIAARRHELMQQEGLDIVREVDGGFVYRGKDGNFGYTSPNYATTDPEKVSRIVKGEAIPAIIQQGFDQELIANHGGAAKLNEFTRGAPFVGSYIDEAVGVVSPTARDAMRASTGAMQREKPGQTAALNIAGGVAYSAPFAVAAAPTVAANAPKSTLARSGLGMLAGSTAGATEGFIYGYGEGTGDERLKNAGTQAGIGAALGAVIGAGGPFAANVFESLSRKFKGRDVSTIAKEFNVSGDAARILRKAFQNNDMDAAKRILVAGPDATMADAGRSGQALLDAAAQTGGRPMQIVDDAVQARAGNALTVVNDGLDSALGPVRGPRAAAREIAESTAPTRQAAYDAAYSQPINYASDAGRRVEEVLGRVEPKVMARAVEEANAEMLSKGHRNLQVLYDADTGQFFEMPNLQQLDQIKRALGNLGAENVDNFGRQTQAGARASRLAGDVRDAATGAVPEYKAALAAGGDKIQLDEGLRLGLDMLSGTKTTREMVQEQLSKLPADAREMVKVGLRSHIDEVLSRVKIVASDSNTDAREAMAALKMLTSRDAETKLKYLLGNDAKELLPQLKRAQAAMEMRASVARNSATAVRQSIQGEANEIMQPGVVGTLARGKPVNAVEGLTQSLMATTPGDDAFRREEVWTEVARVLSERRGSARTQQALRIVDKAISGQPLSDLESKLIANELATGLLLSGSRSANQVLSR